jgi:hypothetical protein
MALSVTHIAAHAFDKHAPDIADAIIEHNLLSAWLREKGRMKVMDGGKTFHEKVIYDEINGAGWIAKDAEIPLIRNDNVTDAEYNIRVIAMPLKIFHLDKSMAQGESQIASIVETLIQSAKSTMSNLMGIAVFNDGSDTNALHGLRLLIADANDKTVGGIDSGTYSWWERQLGTSISAFGTSQEGEKNISALIRACAGNDHDWPDLLVTTSTVFGLYRAALTNIVRLADTKVGNLGFQSLDFQGIPFSWDFNCPSGHLYCINSKYMTLRVLRGGEFVTSDWERVQGQLADYATMHAYVQLTTNNRKKLGVITSIA